MLQNKLRNYINILSLVVLFYTLLIASVVCGDNNSPHKGGYGLKYYDLKVGMEIPLHSLIEMPYLSEEGFLSIEFSRSDVEEKFIRALFYGEDKNVVSNIHPFAHRGIEPILTRDKLILNIYSGVILHLRNDMKFFPNYKTFKNEKIRGRVTQVKGKVSCSFDHVLIKKMVKDLFVNWIGTSKEPNKREAKVFQQPDGSYITIIPFAYKRDIPPRYPPKIIENGKQDGSILNEKSDDTPQRHK